MGLPNRPTSELVAAAWIASIDGFNPGMVGEQLPPQAEKDGSPAAWVKTGFVTATVVGGTPDPDLPVQRPVMQVDTWAIEPGSGIPPWGFANRIAEAIKYAAWNRYNTARPLAISNGPVSYPPAVVRSAVVLTEPRRVTGDPGNAARYQFDLALDWVRVGDRLD